MPNKQLDSKQLVKARELLGRIRKDLDQLSKGDRELRFAYNRKIFKELCYDERGKPAHRSKLKLQKFELQNRKCKQCKKPLELKGSVLDRKNAVDGYTVENTNLIHPECDRKIQKERGFK
ncbi:MAG: hypothetical protein AB7P76_04065 [Candidatus Melainabacteria bacterium]